MKFYLHRETNILALNAEAEAVPARAHSFGFSYMVHTSILPKSQSFLLRHHGLSGISQYTHGHIIGTVLAAGNRIEGPKDVVIRYVVV